MPEVVAPILARSKSGVIGVVGWKGDIWKGVFVEEGSGCAGTVEDTRWGGRWSRRRAQETGSMEYKLALGLKTTVHAVCIHRSVWSQRYSQWALPSSSIVDSCLWRPESPCDQLARTNTACRLSRQWCMETRGPPWLMCCSTADHTLLQCMKSRPPRADVQTLRRAAVNASHLRNP